jgi:hypothetical protein
MASRKKFLKNGFVNPYDVQHTGEEPIWEDAEKITNEEKTDRMLNAFNFYTYYLDREDFHNFVMEWMVKDGYSVDDLKAIRKVPKAASLSTAGKLCRMFLMGMEESFGDKYHGDFVRKTIVKALEMADNVKKETTEEEKKPTIPAVSPMKRLEMKVNEYIITPIDFAMDDWVDDPSSAEPLNVQSLLGAHSIPAKGCQFVINWLNVYIKDLTDAQAGDPDCVEGYAFLTKRQLNKWVKAMTKMKEDVEKYQLANQKTVVRTKKVKPAGVQVANVNYDKEGSPISAVKIPGAIDVVIFNTKTRKLQVYKAVGRQGLSVKGTSIKDFDEVKSYQVTVRANLVDDVIGKEPKAIEKIISSKTKRTKVNGRLNEHCRVVYVK